MLLIGENTLSLFAFENSVRFPKQCSLLKTIRLFPVRFRKQFSLSKIVFKYYALFKQYLFSKIVCMTFDG